MLLHCIFTCIISDKKTNIILIFVPLIQHDFCSFWLLLKFHLLLVLNNSIMIHVGAALLYFLCLGFIKFLGSVGLQFSLNLESFQSLFLQVFFLPPFCLFFENSNSTLGYLKFRSPLMLFSFLFLKFFYLLVFYFG